MLAGERRAPAFGKPPTPTNCLGSSYHPPAVTSLLSSSWSSSGMGLLEIGKTGGGVGGNSMPQKSPPRVSSPLPFQNWTTFFLAPILSCAFEIFCLDNSSSKSFAPCCSLKKTQQNRAGHEKILSVLQSRYHVVQKNWLFFPRFSSNNRLNGGYGVMLHVPKEDVVQIRCWTIKEWNSAGHS